jgi:hypothetical protein
MLQLCSASPFRRDGRSPWKTSIGAAAGLRRCPEGGCRKNSPQFACDGERSTERRAAKGRAPARAGSRSTFRHIGRCRNRGRPGSMSRRAVHSSRQRGCGVQPCVLPGMCRLRNAVRFPATCREASRGEVWGGRSGFLLDHQTAAQRRDDAGDLIETSDAGIPLDPRHALLVDPDPLPEICLAELPILPHGGDREIIREAKY